MTEEAIKIILATLAVAYPNAYGKIQDDDTGPIVELWMRQFADYRAKEVGAAVDAIIATRTSGYAPTIGEIKNQIQKLRDVNTLSETEAWAMVAKACRNGIYGYKKEFDKLPPEVQRAVGRPEQLRDWAMVDTEELSTVVASNFMRGFKERRSRDREQAMLPPNVKALIADLGNKMQIGGEKHDFSLPEMRGQDQ